MLTKLKNERINFHVQFIQNILRLLNKLLEKFISFILFFKINEIYLM